MTAEVSNAPISLFLKIQTHVVTSFIWANLGKEESLHPHSHFINHDHILFTQDDFNIWSLKFRQLSGAPEPQTITYVVCVEWKRRYIACCM